MAPLLLLCFSFLLASLLTFFLAKMSWNHGQINRRPLPPGPKGWPVFGNLFQLGTHPHQTLHAISRVYGPLLRLRLGSTTVVVASSATTAAAFLKTHDSNFSSRPNSAGATHMAYGGHDLVWARYGPRWRMLRRVCALNLVSPKAVDDFRDIRQEEVSRLMAKLAAPDRGMEEVPINVGDWLCICVTNALTRAMMGRRLFVFEAEVDANGTSGVEDELRMVKEFKDMTWELLKLGGEFVIGDYLPALAWLDPNRVVAKMKALHKRFDSFLDAILQEHLASYDRSSDHKDMMSILIGLKENADEDGGKLSDTEIKALLLNLYIAGTDTVLSTLEWALTELIRHPEIMRQAQMEIDEVVGRQRLVSEADLAHLPFLNAILKENFRLHPASPLALPHLASDDCEIGGYSVPSGATLLVNIWAICRDPSIWPDPLKFQPARFLPGGEAEHVDVRGNHFELIPFGSGRRSCAGINWGLRLVYHMTATLVHAFDWDLPAGQKPEDLNIEEGLGLSLHKAEPLLVLPRRRLDATAYVVATH